MTSENFGKWMKHFITHSHCSVEKPVLLLLDNHDSHITIEVLDMAKANGVIMLTFPQHFYSGFYTVGGHLHNRLGDFKAAHGFNLLV